MRVTYAPETAITDINGVEPVLPTRQKTDQGERRPPETRRGNAEALHFTIGKFYGFDNVLSGDGADSIGEAYMDGQ